MNKETKFTKGEWVIRDNGSYFDIGPINNGYTYPSVCIGVSHEDKANAHLIKTAPKLYEMLEYLRENVDMNDQQYDRVTSILAEARGE